MFSFFLAKKFFNNEHSSKEGKRKASVPAIRIATIGIAVGLAVMIVSICVVKGFQHEVSRKLTGFASHIEVMDIHSLVSPEGYPVVTDTSLIREISKIQGVSQVQRISEKIGIFKTQNDFSGIVLKGVDQHYDLNFISENLVEGKIPNFRDDKTSNSIVISRSLANSLKLKLGDKVYSYFFANTIKQRRFVVAGIYDTHMPQFDKMYVLTDLYTVNRLNGWESEQSSALEIKLSSFDDLSTVQSSLLQKVGGKKDSYGNTYTVLSVRENPRTASVLSWLDLLDFNVMIILVIMVALAGFTMISGLLILILERTNTIGVLKAMGATNGRIQSAFLWFAAFIIGRGLLLGNILGLALVFIQQTFHIVSLDPDTYYVDSVPVEVNVLWIVALNVVSLLVTVLALVIPSLLVSRVEPAKAIQFD